MFDFPASPALGQTFTPTVGGPAYVWDGVAWKLSSGGLSGSVFIGDAPPANPQHGQLWWESDTGNTFIYYQDSNSGQWVQFNIQGGSAGYALPRNRIVNGAFQISQENGDTPSGTNGYFLADQWIISSLHGGVHSAQSLPSNAPAARTAGRVSCTTADASVAAGDLLGIYHPIEGLNVADFYWGDAARAKPAVLRFTAWSANGGTFCVALRNAAIDASFVSEFTLVAGVWTDVVIPVPACTSGTVWPSTNVLSGSLLFSLMCGSNYQTTTPNAWVAGDKRSTASQTNIMGVVGNDFRVTSVGLYLDPDNTGLAPPWQMPDEAEELRACERYYEKSYQISANPGTAGQIAGMTYINAHATAVKYSIRFSTRKRIPTVAMAGYSYVTGASGMYRDVTANVDRAVTLSAGTGETAFTADFPGTAIGSNIALQWVANARM